MDCFYQKPMTLAERIGHHNRIVHGPTSNPSDTAAAAEWSGSCPLVRLRELVVRIDAALAAVDERR